MELLTALCAIVVIEAYRRMLVRRNRVRAGDGVHLLRGQVAWGESGLLIGRAAVHFIDLSVRRQVSIGDECVVEVLPIVPLTVLRVVEINGAPVHPEADAVG